MTQIAKPLPFPWTAGLLLALLYSTFLLPSRAYALDVSWGIEGGVRFNYQKNGLNYATDPLQFNEDTLAGNLLLSTELTVKFNDYLSFYGNVDMGELYAGRTSIAGESTTSFLLSSYQFNQTPEEQAAYTAAIQECETKAKQQGVSTKQCQNPSWYLAESFFIRELYLSLNLSKKKWVTLQAGFLNRNLGRALIMDDYVLGARLGFDLYKRNPKTALPLQINVDAFLPDTSLSSRGKSSPVLNLEFNWRLGDDDEGIGIFFSYMRDGDNLAGQLLLPIWREYFNDQLNQRIAKDTGESPGIDCEGSYNADVVKSYVLNRAGGPRDRDRIKRQQKSCEQANVGKPEEKQEVCPVDKLISDYIAQYNAQVCGSLPESRGHHLWVGIQGNKSWGKFKIEGAAILYVSSMNVSLPKVPKPSPRVKNSSRYRPPSRPERTRFQRQQRPLIAQQKSAETTTIDVQDVEIGGLGFAAELNATYKWTERFSTDLFFLFATGDRISGGTRPSRINTFIGITPQLRYTDIFFNGGINAFSAQRDISIGGISGRGYIVPGLNLNYEIEEKLNLKFTAALLFSQVKPPPDPSSPTIRPGRTYGYEFNINASYRWLKWLRPVAQIDFFVPGNFFRHSKVTLPTGLFQILLGVDLVFGNDDDDDDDDDE